MPRRAGRPRVRPSRWAGDARARADVARVRSPMYEAFFAYCACVFAILSLLFSKRRPIKTGRARGCAARRASAIGLMACAPATRHASAKKRETIVE